jgi:hypothetical protein
MIHPRAKEGENPGRVQVVLQVFENECSPWVGTRRFAPPTRPPESSDCGSKQTYRLDSIFHDIRSAKWLGKRLKQETP